MHHRRSNDSVIPMSAEQRGGNFVQQATPLFLLREEKKQERILKMMAIDLDPKKDHLSKPWEGIGKGEA